MNFLLILQRNGPNIASVDETTFTIFICFPNNYYSAFAFVQRG